MNGLFGWSGKILKVDLTVGKTAPLQTADYSDRYLGGLGIGEIIYWHESRPELDAFHPEMPLIMMTGPLAGTPAPSASRMVVCGKSPCIYPETFASASLGGFFAADLKRAGYDGIVIKGKAASPVYLAITGDNVEIKDARHLWGLLNSNTHHSIKEALDARVQILSIGPGGENQTRLGTILGDIGSSAGMGFGSIMGSKNLKAIAVSGTGVVPVADRPRLDFLREHFRTMTGEGYFNVFGTPNQFPGSGVELVRKAHCYNCPQGCYRALFRSPSGREDIAKCVASIYYRSWDARLHHHLTDASFHATVLANDYSICTSDLMILLQWLYRCQEQGALTEKETGLQMSQVGSSEFLEGLIKKICSGESFGAVMSQGVYRAAMMCGQKTRDIAEQFLTPSGRAGEAYNPRVFITPAMLYATEVRPSIAGLHEVCKPLVKWAMWYVSKGKDSYVNTEVLRKIGGKFWGSEKSVDFSTYDGKALAAVKIQNRISVKESLPLCDFAFPVFDNAGTPDHVGDPALESQFFAAATGMDIDEEALEQFGERIFNLNRAILLREGRQGKTDDRLPDFYFTEGEQPIPDAFGRRNPELFLPAAGDSVVSRKGMTVDRDKFSAMRDEYYSLRGWDIPTGLLTASGLKRLGLGDIIGSLKGKVVPTS